MPVSVPSILDAGKVLAQLIKSTTSWLLIPTFLADHILEPWVQINRPQRLCVVVADATKIFIATEKLDHYRKHGIDFCVIQPIKLLCITANPISPEAENFDPPDFVRRLHAAIPDVPILDVISEVSSIA
jgi:hypothetical protein